MLRRSRRRSCFSSPTSRAIRRFRLSRPSGPPTRCSMSAGRGARRSRARRNRPGSAPGAGGCGLPARRWNRGEAGQRRRAAAEWRGQSRKAVRAPERDGDPCGQRHEDRKRHRVRVGEASSSRSKPARSLQRRPRERFFLLGRTASLSERRNFRLSGRWNWAFVAIRNFCSKADTKVLAFGAAQH